MIRKATNADIGKIAMFLEQHIDTSMFLMSNLMAFGTEDTEHPHGTRYFLRETGDGVNGVFGATNNGFLLIQMPGLTTTEAQFYAYMLQGYTMVGMTGDDEQVAMVLDALTLPEDRWKVNDGQALFALDLADLPDGSAGSVRAPDDSDRRLLTDWVTQYLTETQTGNPAGMAEQAQAFIDQRLPYLLIEDGQPVAMAALNARVGDTVQVGGVFVPKPLRGQGRAGRVVAGHLAELADEGDTRALLFAASDDAARAYRKIGFQRVGTYRVAILRDPVTLGNPR